jgi:hypothetical protein
VLSVEQVTEADCDGLSKPHDSVEFGVGYGGVFSKYKVFESYAWMHSIYAMFKNPTTVDGNFYDAVIPDT